jgi:ABC-type transport system involved in multi-copper enzyme maturation permease subunit
MSLFVFREQLKLVVDSSMATTLFFGLLAAVLCASHAITRELSNGTVLLLLSKPVPRWSFVLSKMGGILAALTVFVFICNCATLLSLRVAKDQFDLDYVTFYIYFGVLLAAMSWGAYRNFYARKSFSASSVMSLFFLLPLLLATLQFVAVEGETMSMHTEVVPALLLLFFAVWTMGGISVMISAKLDMTANLLISSILFFLGLIADYFFGTSAGTFSFSGLLYAAIPNWQFFWMADALANKKSIPLDYIGWTAVYTMFYIVLCSIIAITLFSDKEVAENVR